MTAVWLYNLTGLEKISVRELNSWLDCLRDVLAPSTSNFHLLVGQSPLQLFSSSSSFPALSLVSTGAHLSAWPRSEASLLSTPMPLRWRGLWWESSHWSCVPPLCERRQRKKCLLPACFACQLVEDYLVTCLVRIEGNPGNYLLSHCPSLSISTDLSHPAIDPTSLCPFASRYPYSSFLYLWFFPSFLAPCDLVVISTELNGEARGCISVQSLNSSSTMQTVLAYYLHTQRNGWLKNGWLWAGGGGVTAQEC